jgi:hypothetical protein
MAPAGAPWRLAAALEQGNVLWVDLKVAPACQRREREPGPRQHAAPLGVIGQRQGDSGHTTRSSSGPAQFDDGRVVRGRV